MSTPPHHSQALKALKAKEGNEKQAKGGELLSPGIFCPLSPAEGGGDRPRNISGVEPKQSQCNTQFYWNQPHIWLKRTIFLVETKHIFVWNRPYFWLRRTIFLDTRFLALSLSSISFLITAYALFFLFVGTSPVWDISTDVSISILARWGVRKPSYLMFNVSPQTNAATGRQAPAQTLTLRHRHWQTLTLRHRHW